MSEPRFKPCMQDLLPQLCSGLCRCINRAATEASPRIRRETWHEIVREYQDSPCLSGRDSFHGLQQMLAEVSEIRPTILIEWSADRISRDPSTVEVTKKSLRDAGCGVEYIAGGSREDTPEGRLIESFFDGLEGAASAQ